MRWSTRASGHLGADPVSDGPAGAGAAQGDRGHDASAAPESLAARRAAVVDLPWSWLRQVHGAGVVVVDEPGGRAGAHGDALVTSCPDAALAVFTADCAPLVLASPQGVVGVAHAGWRGLMEGVVQATVQSMRALGADEIEGWLGPCIRSGCYEFGIADLDAVAAEMGECVRARTMWGTPALDLPAAVSCALEGAGGRMVGDSGACTACSRDWFSHRARADIERQATVGWLATDSGPSHG